MKASSLGALFLIAASACFPQSTDCGGTDPRTVNGFADDPQGYNIYPGNRLLYKYCAFLENPNNPLDRFYVNGVQVQASVTSVNGSGSHIHEIAGTQRPSSTFLSPTPSLTAVDGCVTFSIQLPKFAGWYTINATSSFGRTGVNLCSRYWAGAIANPTYLVPYPDNQQNNRPQVFHADVHHSYQDRYFTPNVVQQITNASEAYAIQTAAQTNYPDLLDITRGSLQYGGSEDNEGPGFTPDGEIYYPTWVEWSVRSFETHSQGVEVDIVSPLWAFDPTHVTMAIQALSANNCVLGQLDSSGNKLPPGGPTVFWGQKDIMHFVCRPNSNWKY